MRRRERAFALVLGTICTLGLVAGAWPLPLIAFALLELGYSAVERAADARANRVRRRSEGPVATGRIRLELSSAVRHEHLASG
jgi:hypothetical protein